MPNSMREDEFEGRPELVKMRARSIFAFRMLVAIAIAWAFITSTITTVDAVIGLQTRAEIVDCTDPEGQCYREGQKRTASFIDELIQNGELRSVITRQVVVAAAICAHRPENLTVQAVETCVEELLDEVGEIDGKDAPR